MRTLVLGSLLIAACSHRSVWTRDETRRISQTMASSPEDEAAFPEASSLGPSLPLAEGTGKDVNYRIRPGFTRPVAKKRPPRATSPSPIPYSP